MSRVKEEMMKCQDRGYTSNYNFVCHKCVGDYALKNFIRTNGEKHECSYCKKKITCVTVEDLLSEIMSGISFEYGEAIECMNYEEGEYVGATTWDTYELLYDIYDEMELNDKLFEDVSNNINNTTWCQKDPYELRDYKQQLSMWSSFCDMVKTKTRYVFFRMPEYDKYDEMADYLILDQIGNAVDKLELIEVFPAGTLFFRGRMHDSKTNINEAKELSSPPFNKAKSNRMSAEGISIFYGANDEKTAITEIYDSHYNHATVASFENLNELYILNLTKIDAIQYPSLFDRERRNLRESISFLRRFNDDLTRPIKMMESIEYIPAQIIAEYFRFLYKNNNKSINGIAYNSSKVKNGICYALFFDQKQCLATNENEFNNPQMIKLIENSIHTYKVNSEIVLNGD